MTEQVVLRSGAVLDLSGPPLVMAVINCTEDSFYAPSRSRREEGVNRALKAVEEGAALVDFGGESSRPGAAYVSVEEELDRILPVLREFRRRSPSPISVDTRKAAVARAVLDAGADIINDISALGDDLDLPGLCAREKATVVLMHKKGIPMTMQEHPYYEDVLKEVGAFLSDAARRAREAGISADHIILDPGIGFGKRLEDNLHLLAGLAELRAQGYPLLVGLSRKSFIGMLTGREAEDRLAGTLGANAAALSGGARILRVHDVRETVDFINVWYAIRKSGETMEGRH